MEKTLTPIQQPLTGEIYVPGDKSISHRAIMFGSLVAGKTNVENFLAGEDCIHTIEIFRHFGVKIKQEGTNVVIESDGISHFKEPSVPLYFGNSGTTARLMLGILAALPFHTVVYGDPHLTKRPMDRVVHPLRQMGAKIDGRKDGLFLPLAIRGSKLTGMEYALPVKSAQVKSALLLAGLFAEGETCLIEKATTRDHTENMLRAFGVDLVQTDKKISIKQGLNLKPVDVVVPGDISSAAFFLAAASIVPDSNVTLRNVGLNQTRSGILEVLTQMGANYEITNEREISGELLGDILITYSNLTSMTIDGDLIPKLIDEIPIISLLATQAEGTTVIKNAEELRVKETDRIHAVVSILNQLGANVEEKEDGMIIHGKTALIGGKIKSYSDHRIAMMGVVASLITQNEVILDDISSVNVSYPGFFDDLKQVSN